MDFIGEFRMTINQLTQLNVENLKVVLEVLKQNLEIVIQVLQESIQGFGDAMVFLQIN